MNVWKVVLGAALGAILALLALVYIVGMDVMDAFYVAFTFGSVVAAIIGLGEKEQNIGTVAAFSALVLLLGLFGSYLPLKSMIVIRTISGEIALPIEFLPWIGLGVIAFFAVGVFLGADVGRLGLFTLGVLLSMTWFVVDGTMKVLVSTLVAIIAAIPLIKAESRRAPMFLAAAPLVPAIDLSNRAAYVVDLSGINTIAMIVTPILLFIALDPFDIIRGPHEKTVEGLGSVAVLALSFLQMLSVLFGI